MGDGEIRVRTARAFRSKLHIKAVSEAMLACARAQTERQAISENGHRETAGRVESLATFVHRILFFPHSGPDA